MTEDVDQTLADSVLVSLTRRQEKSGLKKALLADLASRENLAQMKELNMLFLELDVNGDGSVSAEDVHKSLEGKWPKPRIDELVQALLGGNDKEVSYEEFMGQLIAAKEPVENELLLRVFTEVDRQRKGYLDQDDINALLARPAVAKVLGDRDPAELMKQMSRRSTRRVTFDEFKIALQGNGQTSQFDGRLSTCRSTGQLVFGARTPNWLVGQSAEYYSYVQGAWITCVITAVDAASGAVQVDFKGQYWLRGLEMFTRLRRPHTNAWLTWFHWTLSCAGVRSTCGKG
jgi:Ca2+-binding EF-hand superfamily protein